MASRGSWMMMLVLGAGLAAAPAAAQEQPGDTLQVHVVRDGDTLWDIARRYLNDPFRWTDVFQLNRSVVANPHLIYPAERLRIPLRGSAGLAGAPTVPDQASPLAADAIPPAADRTVFYQPESAAATEHRLRLAEGAPPSRVTRGDHLRAGVLAEESEIVPVGHLVELISPTVVPIEMAPQIQLFDRVYMTVLDRGLSPGDELQLVRTGRRVRPYGWLHETTGTARILEMNGDVATVSIEEMFDVVAVGDAALPMPRFQPRPGVTPQPADGLEGHIIGFRTEHALQNVEDIAFITLGRASGVTEGDEFSVLMPAEQRSWGTRPEIEVARLRVVRAAESTAAARVVALDQPALEAGLVVRLVARMP